MPTIQVIHKGGGVVEVYRGTEFVGVKDAVLWQFHSLKPDEVDSAKVEINQGTKFFKSRGGGGQNSRTTDLDSGRGHLLGTAPDYNRDGSYDEKYSVEFLLNGKQVAYEDPHIVVDKP